MKRPNFPQPISFRVAPSYLFVLSAVCLIGSSACSGDGGSDDTTGDGDGDAVSTGGTSPGSGGADGATGGTVGTGGDDGTGGATGGMVGTGGDDGTGGDIMGTGGDMMGTGGDDGTGGDGTGGAMDPVPDAVATAAIVGINGSDISGTATFTEIDGMVDLVIELEGCPTAEGSNPHGSHLHEVNDCGNDGTAAGGHWASGEVIGNIQCDQASTEYTVSISTDVWTIGGDASTDITQHALMIHDGPTGTRIGCGEIAIVQ